MIHLVRHAHAGPRRGWHGPDEFRPLSAKGLLQARGLEQHLAALHVGLILSSPAARCRQTVAPVAVARGIPVVLDPRLGYGCDGGEVLAAVLRPAEDDAVLCTHGEVIGRLFAELARRGAAVAAQLRRGKGSVWQLEFDGRALVSASYVPAPRVGTSPQVIAADAGRWA